MTWVCTDLTLGLTLRFGDDRARDFSTSWRASHSGHFYSSLVQTTGSTSMTPSTSTAAEAPATKYVVKSQTNLTDVAQHIYAFSSSHRSRFRAEIGLNTSLSTCDIVKRPHQPMGKSTAVYQTGVVLPVSKSTCQHEKHSGWQVAMAVRPRD